MYAAIRRYRVDARWASEVIRQIVEGFMPLIEETPGIRGYYVLDAQDGAFATVTICEHRAAVEASEWMAADWMSQFLASTIRLQGRASGFSGEVQEPLRGILYVGVPEIPVHRKTQLLSPREVCEVLGMGKSWVYQRIRSGEIPSINLGGSVKVNSADLEEYLEKHRRHETTNEEDLPT